MIHKKNSEKHVIRDYIKAISVLELLGTTLIAITNILFRFLYWSKREQQHFLDKVKNFNKIHLS